MIECVVGCDPGLATGISRVFPRGGHEGAFTLDHLSASAWLYACGEHYGPRCVFVVEEFIPRKGVLEWQPESIEVTGVCKFVSYKFGCGLVLQSPADAKAFASNNRLRELEWWTKGSSDHAHDADRHVLLYFARCGWFNGYKITLPEETTT